MWERYGRVRGHRPSFGGCTRLKAEPWWVDGDVEGRGKTGSAGGTRPQVESRVMKSFNQVISF